MHYLKDFQIDKVLTFPAIRQSAQRAAMLTNYKMTPSPPKGMETTKTIPKNKIKNKKGQSIKNKSFT